MDIAFSSCPNDTFIFHAMLNGFVDTRGLALTPHIHDVEELNRRAFSGRHDVTKMSFCAYLHLKESYSLLESGSALGFGCGPLLVARRRDVDLSGARVAIPGIHTTAYLLMLLWNSGITDITPMRFDEIMPAVAEGRFDAGLIIHEGRFVYPDHGLECVIDLGSWWEEETGAAIPLGCIAVKKSAGAELYDKMNLVMRDSVAHALENPGDSMDFVRLHAQEMDEAVMREHIGLYVNDFTLDLGPRGHSALDILEKRAAAAGLIAQGAAG